MSKLARPGSEGNVRLLKQYGGGSSPPRQHYASGGVVAKSGSNPALAEGIAASGSPAKPNTSKPGRKAKGKNAGKKGTNVNVIVMPKGDDKPPMPPMPPVIPMPEGPPPMPMPPVGAGPVGPPPGGPPMPPMRATGGRVVKAPKMDAGAGGAKGRLEKIKAYGV